MIDVLYVLGSGSIYDNLELRLSLRCLEANGRRFNRIFVVGVKPEWIQNIFYIPEKDNLTREKNTFKKVLTACRSDISDEFLFMNDDFFMMKEFDAETYPYFVTGKVVGINRPSRYQKIQNKTLSLLESRGISPVLDFRGHCPIRYNKEKFLSMEEFFNKSLNSDVGYSHRILYGNLFVKEVCSGVKDCKLWSETELVDNVQGCISSREEGIEILRKIEKIYNKPSKYEKSV